VKVSNHGSLTPLKLQVTHWKRNLYHRTFGFGRTASEWLHGWRTLLGDLCLDKNRAKEEFQLAQSFWVGMLLRYGSHEQIYAARNND
jgi:hypothetical protein